MRLFGTPDLLSAGILSRSVARVNADILRSAEELSSGRKRDVVAAAGGDATRVYALERDLARVASVKDTIALGAGRSGQMQASLDRIQGALGEIGVPLLAAVTRGDLSAAKVEARAARGAFDAAVGALNARFGGRSLFAGTAVDGAALAPADTILADIAALVGAATDAADVIAAVDTYFADPGGFATAGYVGSSVDIVAADVGDGQTVAYALRGDRQEFRDALAGLAVTVIGVEGGWAGAGGRGDGELLAEGARRIMDAQEAVIGLRADVGVAEERFEDASVRAEAESTFLSSALNRILTRDPFEAATEFTALETQLQSVFSVTARLSGLNLTNFLR